MPIWNTTAIASNQWQTPTSVSQRKTVKQIWVDQSANLANRLETKWGSLLYIPEMRVLKSSFKEAIHINTLLHKSCLCASSYWRSQSNISMTVWMKCRSPWQINLAESLFKCRKWLIGVLMCARNSWRNLLPKSCKNRICRCPIADLQFTNKTKTELLIWV